LTYHPIKEDERWELIFDKELKVYQNKKVMPRAFIAYNYRVIQNEKDLLQILDSPDFNPRETVILNSDIKKPRGPVSPHRVEIIKYSPLEIKIDVYTERPGILVLSDSFYPGWLAKVDTCPVKIFQAYSVFRAIPLSEGSHRVIFRYLPISFILGCSITIITLSVIILEGLRRSIK
jgi:hypothetical protein